MPANPNLLVSDKQRIGAVYEAIALTYLSQQGLKLIVQNWQQPKVGEIDLIMQELGDRWNTLVFVEVRQRKSSNFGDSLTSVTVSKQRKIAKTARYFMQRNPRFADYECRFDVVGFDTSYNDLQSLLQRSLLRQPLLQQSLLQEPPLQHKEDHQGMPTLTANEIDALSPQWVQGAFLSAAW